MKIGKRLTVLITTFLLTMWVVIVVQSGRGWNPFQQRWDFTSTGAFGDSFGPLGAIMAALAAYVAFQNLHEQRQEIDRIRTREAEEDERRKKQEAEQAKWQRLQQAADAKRTFENTFFNLLTALREIVRETDIGKGENRKTSRDAFKAITTSVVISYNKDQNLKRCWNDSIELHKNDLNHYFRLLYHVISFVDSHDNIDRYFYIRLVRANLSESELVLLFINCAVGEGEEKFKPLIEKYAILHNISNKSRTAWKMDDFFDISAFDYGVL